MSELGTVHNPAVCAGNQVVWHLDPCNEAGWRCAQCCLPMPGEPPGFSPELDRSEIGEKVEAIAQFLQAYELLYFSNSTEGVCAVREIAMDCKALGLYDQYSIIRLLAGYDNHADYWKDLSEKILSGNDPRRRCVCGKLASSFPGDKAYCSTECEVRDSKQGRLPF